MTFFPWKLHQVVENYHTVVASPSATNVD